MSPNVTQAELGYFAGFFDGEGSVMLSLNKGGSIRLQVACSQNTRTVLDMYKKAFGGNVYRYETKKHGPIFHWRINGKEAVGFLKQMLPYLWVKLAVSKEAIHAWNIRDDREELARIVSERKAHIQAERNARKGVTNG